MSRIIANYHLFSLDDIIRKRTLALGIRRQKLFSSYRRSSGGSTTHRIRTHITNAAKWTKLDKFSTQHRPTNSGVNSNILIKINIQQTVLRQTPNIISLNVINAQSICGPKGKTEDLIDHITLSHVDICVMTETFLTEQNNVTCAALHLPGYAFKINQGQLGLQGEVLESSIVTLYNYQNYLTLKEDHLNSLNGVFHGTTTA